MQPRPLVLVLSVATGVALGLAGCKPSAESLPLPEKATPVLSPPAVSASSNAAAVPPPRPAKELPEALMSGPIHESFAEPVTLKDEGGLVVPIEPPPTITEAPPANRPQGKDYAWIPGYWAWDVDRTNYVWVSACWRVAPPGMSWVPGYWTKVDKGWEWVAGFWTPDSASEIEYLAPPPELADTQPVGAPPTDNSVWVPPCWYWNDGRYVLRAGYWLDQGPNWIWIPSHYIWTPRGYVFDEGYWDYPLEERGVLFAPIFFPSSYYGLPDYLFTPSVVVDLGVLTTCLFAYPRYCHYWYGDFFDPLYAGFGIYPWFEFEVFHSWCDPIFEFDRCRFRRSDPRWEENLRRDFDRRRSDARLRPPRDIADIAIHENRLPAVERGRERTIRTFDEHIARPDSSIRYEPNKEPERRQTIRESAGMQAFREERSRRESATMGGHAAGSAVSHIAPSVPTAQPAREYRLPERPEYTAPRPVYARQPERIRYSAPVMHGMPGGGKWEGGSAPSKPSKEWEHSGGNWPNRHDR